jgi:hypothetical protein
VELLEREVPTLEFFETLESDHDDGLVQRRGKAHERRPFVRKAKARVEIPSEGKRLREERPTEPVTRLRRERTFQVHESRSRAWAQGGVGVGLRAGTEARPVRRSPAEGAARGESRGGYWEGETSESFNPMDGFGMK